ncbi:organic cation transporter protein-like [Diprion similis]|uniref:organic cation transporter protein-like n=1 Tax=Diprion similis TaxID=362088 RepID=UPI001EF984B3|nr:organic cation transporter protein-like [Diprion similis]
MGYDDVISHLGEFGPYQRKIFLVIYLPMVSCAFHLMGGTYLAGRPEFRCLMPEENPDNVTYEENTTHPIWDNDTGTWTRCKRYDLNYQILNDKGSSENLSLTPPLVECDSFVYDESQYGFTVSTKWNLVCNDAWLKPTSESLFMVGVFFGVLVLGGLSDEYGRKTILIWGSVLQLVSSLLVAAAYNMPMYIVCRMILATTTNGLFVVSYVTAIETIGQRTRKPAALGNLFFIIGSILTVCFAYFIRNWRILQIAFTIPTLVLLVFIWHVPESARWLMTKGRLDEAKDVLHKASVVNKVELPRDALNNLLKTDNDNGETRSIEKTSIIDLLRYPIIRKKSLILFFVWFVNNATYYGLSWNTANLDGNVYVTSGIAAAVEVPAFMIMISTIDKCPRRVVLCCCMLLAGTSLVSTLLVPNDVSWPIISLAMIGKLSSAASYTTLYVFTSEQYPTTIRNVGVGACSAVARIAGVVTPQINNLSEISVTLPLVIFGCGSLMAGLLLLLLPETANKKLPETIEELENFKKSESGKWTIQKFKICKS